MRLLLNVSFTNCQCLSFGVRSSWTWVSVLGGIVMRSVVLLGFGVSVVTAFSCSDPNANSGSSGATDTGGTPATGGFHATGGAFATGSASATGGTLATG